MISFVKVDSAGMYILIPCRGFFRYVAFSRKSSSNDESVGMAFDSRSSHNAGHWRVHKKVQSCCATQERVLGLIQYAEKRERGGRVQCRSVCSIAGTPQHKKKRIEGSSRASSEEGKRRGRSDRHFLQGNNGGGMMFGRHRLFK